VHLGSPWHSIGLFGSADWVGYVPSETTEFAFGGAPVHDLRWQSVSIGFVVARALARNLPGALLAAQYAMLGRAIRAREELQVACGSSSIRRYDRWRRRQLRPLDLCGLERPRPGWLDGPQILVALEEGAQEDRNAVETTIASLRRQSYGRWSVLTVQTFAGRALEILAPHLQPNGLLTLLRPGDVLMPYALAAVAQHALQNPQDSIIYGDEDRVDRSGRHVLPKLKPDWSPIYQGSSPYVSGTLFLAAAAVAEMPSATLADLAEGKIPAWRVEHSRGIGHVRRVTLSRPLRYERKARQAQRRSAPPRPDADATIVIPTKDRPDLLRACLTALQSTSYPRYDILVVDNGSTSEAAHRYYRTMLDDRRVRMVERPGPFNFSSLCNAGAAEAKGRVLVFLNDDTSVVRPEWLLHLAYWACRPDCGAVGGKLHYPSGRVQHAGIVLGLGGCAAHMESGASGKEDGYLGALVATREVSAVTGACLAVEASKFAAVGGFDAQAFPVEFSDVDLCLRLEKRCWKSVVVGEALLMHRESASRGRTADGAAQYAYEHRRFRHRWGHRLMDDRYYHPALSLSSLRIRLDG
jgi:GT2 family glycosyltransferase